MSTRKPRRIDAGVPIAGDLIRAMWEHGERRTTVEGRVGTVIYNGTEREFRTADGHILYTWVLQSPGNPVVHLLDAEPIKPEPLFDM